MPLKGSRGENKPRRSRVETSRVFLLVICCLISRVCKKKNRRGKKEKKSLPSGPFASPHSSRRRAIPGACGRGAGGPLTHSRLSGSSSARKLGRESVICAGTGRGKGLAGTAVACEESWNDLEGN